MGSIIIKATNSYGNTLQITQQAAFAVASVTGLTPPQGSVYTSELATKDGSVYNASRSQNRYITLLIYPQEQIEAARLALYQVFKLSKWVRLELKTKARHVTIEGYVESMEGDLYENPQNLQISIVCPDPFFEAVTGSTTVIPEAGTAAAVANNGDEEAGAVFTFTASGACSNISITNETTSQTFGLGLTLESGDEVTIDTRRGSKRVTLLHDGVETNAINAMIAGSAWPQLIPGANQISFDALTGAENLSCSVAFTAIYEGL